MKTIEEIIKDNQKNNYENCLEYFTDKDTIKKIIACDITAFRYIPDSFKDKEMCLFACQCHFSAYHFLPAELKADKEILMEVLSRFGGMLKYCPDEIKDNKEFVLLAVSTDAGSVKYSSPELLKNKEFCKKIVFRYPSTIHFLPVFFNDTEVGMFILRIHPEFRNLISMKVIKRYELELLGII